MGTNLFLPPWYREGEGGPRGEADRIKTLAMNRARAEAIALSDRRTSLSVNDNRGTEQFPLQKQRSQPSSKDSNLQNDILLEKSQLRTRSCTPASRNVSLHTAADFSASLELPDMSKRQKDIQSSLFKILGQNE
jgi:ABC-type phosphate transport system auxiliary subunit